jgi:hypothetical protein
VAPALGEAVNDLLVGEDSPERGAPVDRHVGAVREAAVEELEEDPLRPLVVARVGGRDLALPVVREAERLELAAEAVDVGGGRDRGVRARLRGGSAAGERRGLEFEARIKMPCNHQNYKNLSMPPVPRFNNK